MIAVPADATVLFVLRPQQTSRELPEGILGFSTFRDIAQNDTVADKCT